MRRNDAARGADESDEVVALRQGTRPPEALPRQAAPAMVHRPVAWLAAALLLAATILDLVGARSAPAAFWSAAYRLQAAGLIAAGLAAVPLGVADAWRAARRQRLPRASAVLHIAAVISGVLLHLLAFVLRAHPRIPPDPGVLLVEGLGSVLLIGAIVAGIRTRFHVLGHP